MIKIKKILLGVSACMLSTYMTAQTLDIDKQLAYCHKQVSRALTPA